MQNIKIPFHKPEIGEEEIKEVIDTLRSGWLTTGPKTKLFEQEFGRFCGSPHAIALNSATAALHLTLEAIGIQRGDGVLVPAMTFAASAEVVRYFDAEPVLFDCDKDDLNGDYRAARDSLLQAELRGVRVRAIIIVHYGGLIGNIGAAVSLAREFGLKVVEDAAHCCPALYRHSPTDEWKSPGAETSAACFSFYANKCITTGEGGMAVTSDSAIADRIRVMALHGISKDAWKRFSSDGNWYYEIVAPGFKYNLTDIASSIGLHQLAKAEQMRIGRERVAGEYRALLSCVEGLILPRCPTDRIHSWHLFAIRLERDSYRRRRSAVIEALKHSGIGTSVHWMPLHMHPYYRDRYGYCSDDFPVASGAYEGLISLPIYPQMTEDTVAYVVRALLTALSS